MDNVKIRDVLSFLQDFVDAKKPASTIRGVKAALMRQFAFFQREDVMNSFLVKLHVQGAQKLAPIPETKLFIWDPEIPLKYIANRPRPNDFLNAGKEALLLTILATGMRVDCASKLSKVITIRNEISVIPFLLARKTGISSPQLLKPYDVNERICPVKAIHHFLSLGRRIRQVGEKFLFISSRGNRAHVDTLRHWVTDLLEESGVKASAGSCRSAATSAAFLRELPIDVILKAAGWARESTFRKYYQRLVHSGLEGVNLMPVI